MEGGGKGAAGEFSSQHCRGCVNLTGPHTTAVISAPTCPDTPAATHHSVPLLLMLPPASQAPTCALVLAAFRCCSAPACATARPSSRPSASSYRAKAALYCTPLLGLASAPSRGARPSYCEQGRTQQAQVACAGQQEGEERACDARLCCSCTVPSG